MLTDDLTSSALDLCDMAGLLLTDDDRPTLASMLAREDDRWVHPQHLLPHAGPTVVQARVLAGLLLLDEDIVWSGRSYRRTEDAFRSMHALVTGSLRMLVTHVRATRGDQQITALSGKRLSFVTGSSGTRGRAVDLYVFAEPMPEAMRSARPGHQLIVWG